MTVTYSDRYESEDYFCLLFYNRKTYSYSVKEQNISSVVDKRESRRKGGSSLARGENAWKSYNKDPFIVNLHTTVDFCHQNPHTSSTREKYRFINTKKVFINISSDFCERVNFRGKITEIDGVNCRDEIQGVKRVQDKIQLGSVLKHLTDDPVVLYVEIFDSVHSFYIPVF